ncbi:MAG: hypothetical protein QXG05_00380 [Nitrososphaerota archaeon]
MESSTAFSTRREELEARIRELEEERDTLVRDIAKLKEKIETVELEKRAASIQREVEALRTERAALMEKVVMYAAEHAEQAVQTDTSTQSSETTEQVVEATTQP